MADLDPWGMVGRHCYTQNIKALGFVVTVNKIVLCSSYCMDGAIFDHRGMISRIYIKYR